jgi:hypothetical protein
MDTTLLVLGVCSILLIVAIIFLMGRWIDDTRTAQEIISAEKKAFVNREFPTEYKQVKPDEIYRDATDPTVKGLKKRNTRKAKKLLDNEEYDKDK